MNKKISLGIAISLVAIGCAITFVLTWTVSLNIYNSKIGTSEKYEGVYAKLREIDATVRQNATPSRSRSTARLAAARAWPVGTTRSARRRVASGVYGDGLTTTVLPAARAGASFQASSSSG